MFVGIDLGTSGVKVVAVDEDGHLLAEATVAYPLNTPRPGWAEQDPESWWNATVDAVRTVATEVDLGRARAIGLSGQMHTLVLADETGRPTRPAIGWADTRTHEQLRTFEDRVARAHRVGVLGNPAATGFTAPSLMWVKEHDPDAYAAAAHVGLPKDYVRFRLTGRWATDPSDASATLLFDVFERRWAEEVVDALELRSSLLPPVVASADVAGELQPEAAAQLGLPRGTPVVTGAGDQAAAATGCGLVEPGPMLVTLGSGGQVFTPLAQPAADERLRVHLFCHAAPERWHLQGAVQNMGVALEWVRNVLGMSWDALYARAAEVPAGAEGVTFVPHLTGERTPYMDPHARAAWSGLGLSHTPGHLARAAIEGAIYAVAEAVVACTEVGGEPSEIALTGGGARHPLPRQILADALGRPLGIAAVQQGSAMGAAVLAGAPAPAFRTRDEGAAPGADREAHQQAWQRQREAYRGLREARGDA